MEQFLLSVVGRDPAHLLLLLAVALWLERRFNQVKDRLVRLETMMSDFHQFHEDLKRRVNASTILRPDS